MVPSSCDSCPRANRSSAAIIFSLPTNLAEPASARNSRGQESQLDGTMMAFGINGKTAMSELFMSHPPLEKRIQALREMR
jgi:Zn-dependent protease with chaperone function